jgi:hypothetical protein
MASIPLKGAVGSYSAVPDAEGEGHELRHLQEPVQSTGYSNFEQRSHGYSNLEQQNTEYSNYEQQNYGQLNYPPQKSVRQLGTFSPRNRAFFVVEALWSLVPLIFIVITIIAASLNNKRTSSTGHSIEEVLLLLPTIFPIVFAALMGRFFQTFALYRAERGIELVVSSNRPLIASHF